MTVDPVLARIAEAAQLNHHEGRRDEARERLARIWDEIGGEAGDPLLVCVLAHTMADVRDDVAEELTWDLRALAVAGAITDERIARAGVPFSTTALYPSLHLNLCECYRKLGDLDRAREHLGHAQATVDALDDDDYGRLVRGGLERMARQLG